MVDFWAKKREQLQQQGQLPPPPRQEPVRSGPWWDDSGTITATRVDVVRDNTLDNQTEQQYTEPEHDFSKATHLRSKAGNCPNCNSTDYVKPSALVAARCWNCGYIEGRQVNDLDTFVAMQDARTIKVRQTDSAHGIKLGSKANAYDIAKANAQLEASSNGKALIDSE